MNEFPELEGSVRVDMEYCIGNGFSVRKMLLGLGFSPHIKEGDYVVNTKDAITLPQLVLRIYEHGEMCLLADNGVKHVLFVGDGLVIPGEYLVWSDGKDNKTVPLNCGCLSMKAAMKAKIEREGLCQEIPLPLEDVEYVTCTNNTGVEGRLTIGKEYKVVNRYVRHTGCEFITVIDDDGYENWCYASRFVAKEDKGKDRCNFNFNIKSASAKAFKAAASEIRKRVEAGTFKIPAEQVREAMKTWQEHNDSLDYSYEIAHSAAPLEAFSLTNTGTTPYVVCPTTGRKLDPNTLIPLDEVVTFTDKSII